MNIKVCNEGHVYSDLFLKEDQDHCPICGRPLFKYELPPHEDKARPVELAKDTNAPLSVLIAAALVTPQGQRLVLKVLEKIDDKFFK